MAGIYIHIPFCKQACHYCNFHFSTSSGNKSKFLEALNQEVVMRKDYLQGEQVNTVYFGGGTPSLLSAHELDLIMSWLQNNYNIDSKAEITLEANPDDIIQKGYLASLAQTSINRLSIGAQSFFDDNLTYMNRVHSGKDALTAIKKSQAAGFENISVDLIYGTPTLADQKWAQTLDIVCSLKVPHISAYSLTVETNTALEKMIKKGTCKGVNENASAVQLELLMSYLSLKGYEHYEISNFCKHGYISKHNSNYWKGKKYLGLGPSAHSYNGGKRQWNLSNNSKYIQALSNKELCFEMEELSLQDKLNEYIMTSLRTKWGVDLDYLKNNFGSVVLATFNKECMKFIEQLLLKEDKGKIFVTGAGKLVLDKITSDLFQVDSKKEEFI